MKFLFEKWLAELLDKVIDAFGERVIFIGYHGSYARGEATDDSDIDVVVILDNVGIEDLKIYKGAIASMSFPKKACGFIAGENEIASWSKIDIFQFVHEMKPLIGELHFISTPDRSEVAEAAKIGAGNVYHAACHSFLYDEDLKQGLINLYKMVFFIMQADYFSKTGEYVGTKNELAKKLIGQDKENLEICMKRDSITKASQKEIEKLYGNLITWSGSKIAQ